MNNVDRLYLFTEIEYFTILMKEYHLKSKTLILFLNNGKIMTNTNYKNIIDNKG